MANEAVQMVLRAGCKNVASQLDAKMSKKCSRLTLLRAKGDAALCSPPARATRVSDHPCLLSSRAYFIYSYHEHYTRFLVLSFNSWLLRLPLTSYRESA
jgi:hypothetical protein